MSAHERRILGVLIEKAQTTQGGGPLSVNALVTGSNQKSNRDPLLNLSEVEVEEALVTAQKQGLVVKIIGGRAPQSLLALAGPRVELTGFVPDLRPHLAAAAAVVVALALLSRSRIYLLSPYILLGVALWAFVYAGGLHATLAGVVLALFIPARPPADLAALMTQASTIIASEARHEGEVLRHGPSAPTLHALDAIYDRIESPTDRLLRHAGARSSYAVLPIFALANAGVTINPGRLRWAWLAHGRDRRRPRRRKTGRRLPRFRRGRARRHSRQAGGVRVAAVGRGGSPRWHRLHDVALHRRAGVSKRH